MKCMLIFAASAMSASLLVPTLAEARISEDFEQVSEIVSCDNLDQTAGPVELAIDRTANRSGRV